MKFAAAAVLQFSEAVARCYAELYAYFLQPRARAGGNVHDLQIVATCIALGYTLLTSNVADFNKVPGLKIAQPKRVNVKAHYYQQIAGFWS